MANSKSVFFILLKKFKWIW